MSGISPEKSDVGEPHLSLVELAELARATGSFAIDTEFVGEGRYRTLLCLIQIAVCDPSDGLRIALIDPLDETLEAEPLAAVLADPAIDVVLHAGRQDVALLRRCLNTEVRGIFDTQVAAGFIGMSAQSSYESVLHELLGVRLQKSASFTRWDKRPLSQEQLDYAREDVVHLLELAAELKRRLASQDRLGWVIEECRALEQISDERDLEAVLERLPRIRGLSTSSQGIARELVHWREQTARSLDRPVQSIMSDAVLVEIAKRKPSSLGQLEHIRGVGPATLHRRGNQVLEAIRRGLEQPHKPLAATPRQSTAADSSDAPLVALAEALVRARTRDAGLAYELVAARADLQAIVAARRVGGDEPDVRTLRGWRRKVVGEELLDLLDGRLALSVSEREVQIHGRESAAVTPARD